MIIISFFFKLKLKLLKLSSFFELFYINYFISYESKEVNLVSSVGLREWNSSSYVVHYYTINYSTSKLQNAPSRSIQLYGKTPQIYRINSSFINSCKQFQVLELSVLIFLMNISISVAFKREMYYRDVH